MSFPVDSLRQARGLIRLLNTSGGRALCLAGAVDEAVVQVFVRSYGAEPMPVDAIDARSVTALSPAALRLVRDHLDLARWRGRTVVLRAGPSVERLLGRLSEPAVSRRPSGV